jgi:hypothetical protein
LLFCHLVLFCPNHLFCTRVRVLVVHRSLLQGYATCQSPIGPVHTCVSYKSQLTSQSQGRFTFFTHHPPHNHFSLSIPTLSAVTNCYDHRNNHCSTVTNPKTTTLPLQSSPSSITKRNPQPENQQQQSRILDFSRIKIKEELSAFFCNSQRFNRIFIIELLLCNSSTEFPYDHREGTSRRRERGKSKSRSNEEAITRNIIQERSQK